MDSEKNQPSGSRKENSSFLIEGKISREQPECQPGELKLAAYVFDKAGSLLGSADIEEKGGYKVTVRLAQPADVDLFVGPADMPKQIRHSSAYRKTFSAKEWKGEGAQYRLRFDALLPVDVWIPWWPLQICISGHV
ncbi:MAG: hypothetical protein HGB33_10270, partial [Syntrophaceae bacterium]|nr:hypothetical protein [Syntrophaceae bacterium]